MKITTFLLSALLFTGLKAQVEMHESIGPSVLRATDTKPNSGGGEFASDDLTSNLVLFNYNLNYAFPFDSGDHGVGINLGVGAGFGTNFLSGKFNASVSFDVPLSVQYQFGTMSSEESEADFGGFVGVGASYLLNTNYYPFAHIFGPHVEGGFNFPTGEKSLTLKVKIMPISNHDVWSASIGVLYPLQLVYRD